MLLSVSVSIISVIAFCASTSSGGEVLDVVQARKHAAPVHERENDMDKYNHLTIDNTVADVVNNRAFKKFGQYILPLEWRYDPEMKLRNIPSLLPYHNYVDASRAVGYINDIYVVIGANDGIASPALMRRRVEALKAIGIDSEFHLFPNLRHGFGLGIGTSADGWIDGAVKFWERHMTPSPKTQ